MLKQFFAILVVIFCSQYLFAQTNGGEIIVEDPETYVPATDTVITSVEAPIEETYTTEPALVETEEVDTTLAFTNLYMSTDSLYELTNQEKYNWIKTLDSLLKDKKKKEDAATKKAVNNTKEYKPRTGFNLENIFNSGIAKGILYSLAALFVGFILYSLFINKGIFGKAQQTLVEVANTEDEIDLSNDYSALALQAQAAGNYKLATRYLFLDNLKLLNEKQLITFALDKTNIKYCQEIDAVKRPEFSKLCLYYEYVWYGNADINLNNFEVVKNAFLSFKQSV
jgi:hypothetical protein